MGSEERSEAGFEEGATKAELAKLQADTAAPSSFVEEGSPDVYADFDAKLKQLEEKTKAELAKLQADTAAPSSFVEKGRPTSLADIQDEMNKIHLKENEEMEKLDQEAPAAPSSMLETSEDRGSGINIDEQLRILKEKADEEYEKV